MNESQFEKALSFRAFNYCRDFVINQSAGNYTRSYETWKRIYNTASSFKKELLRLPERGLKVLDLGCGDGYYIFLLRSLYDKNKKNVLFDGVDACEADIMLAARIASYMAIDNISFTCADIQCLDLPDNHYDIIINTDVLEHLNYPEKCVEAIYRLLKPGGLAIVSTPNGSNSVSWISRCLAGCKALPSDSSSDSKNVYGEECHAHISLKDRMTWTRIFKEKGFLVEKIQRGAILGGGKRYNKHHILFAIMIIIDRIFDHLHFMKDFSEEFTYVLRKPCDQR